MIPPVASRFVAGETAAEAVDHAVALDASGRGAILNLLGEHYDDRARADADAAAYRRLVADLPADLDAAVSVKPTQLGLDVGEATFREHLRSVVEAADGDTFVWVDMEGSDTTDATLSAYRDLVVDHPQMGVCVQANLRRTREDLEDLAGLPGTVRLVKGAYAEPAEVAYTDRAAVDRSFRECMAYMFEAFDDGIALGTHDPRMIAAAFGHRAEFGTDFEVQMLMGVRERAQRALAAHVPVWQYVPYGGRWLSYFTRRVAERRQNLAFALRAVLGG